MAQTFSLPWANSDIDILDDPPEGWHRVAVIGLWEDAKITRRRWPKAAAVGPLRTVRGIDLLVRALLANPQLRVIVIDGKDLTPGEATTKALIDCWLQDDLPAGLDQDLAHHHLYLLHILLHLLAYLSHHCFLSYFSWK